MSSIRKLSLLTIAVITSLNVLSQERGAQDSKPTAEELRFHNFTAKRPIDIEAFRVSLHSQLSSINLHTLNVSQKSSSKQSAADESFTGPKSAKAVPNRLGDFEPLKNKTDKGTGFEQDRVFTLRSFDFTSSRKRDLSDVK
jgi:hypothetical protein